MVCEAPGPVENLVVMSRYLLWPDDDLLAGGAFEWVSCPHYLGEILIYTGLLLMVHGRILNAWLILAWVVSLLNTSAFFSAMPATCTVDIHTRYLTKLYLQVLLCLQVCNLVLAAGAAHKWYRRKFEVYPRSRRALVPLMY